MIARILVGTPSSSHAGAALEAAAELASTYDAELIVLQVEPIIDARRVFDPDGVPEAPDHSLLLRRSYPGLRVRSHLARGNPARAMCEVATQEHTDLIVIQQGRRGNGGNMLSHRASGALAQIAPCPVLLVAS